MNIENFDKAEYIAKLNEEDGSILLTPKKVDKDWKPKIDENYYFVCGEGKVHCNRNTHPIDENRFLHRNVFPTREQAEKAAKLQRTSNAIIRACLLVDPGFVPDWDGEDKKCTVYFTFENCAWRTTDNYVYKYAPAYVSSEEKAEEVCALLEKWGVKP